MEEVYRSVGAKYGGLGHLRITVGYCSNTVRWYDSWTWDGLCILVNTCLTLEGRSGFAAVEIVCIPLYS